MRTPAAGARIVHVSGSPVFNRLVVNAQRVSGRVVKNSWIGSKDTDQNKVSIFVRYLIDWSACSET